MNQVEILQWFTDKQHPLLTELVRVLTFLGNEEFYFIILPLIYWCFSKSLGFRLFYMFIFSMYVNSFLKISFAKTRPIGTEGVHSLFVESAEVGSHYPHDSFPSGHAQGSTTLWGYLAVMSQSWKLIVGASILILFISVSRLYSGLHWPIDILAGIGIGIVIIAATIVINRILFSFGNGLQWLLAIVVPIIMLLVFPEAEGFKFTGLLLGAGVGYLIEGTYVKMKISDSYIRKAIAFVIGISGMFAIQVGLKGVFPETFVFDGIRYSLIGLWGLWIAPLLFIIFKIYHKEERFFTPYFRYK